MDDLLEMRRERTTGPAPAAPSERSRLVAVILCLLLGGGGVHRLYLRAYASGFILLLLALGSAGSAVLLARSMLTQGSASLDPFVLMFAGGASLAVMIWGLIDAVRLLAGHMRDGHARAVTSWSGTDIVSEILRGVIATGLAAAVTAVPIVLCVVYAFSTIRATPYYRQSAATRDSLPVSVSHGPIRTAEDAERAGLVTVYGSLIPVAAGEALDQVVIKEILWSKSKLPDGAVLDRSRLEGAVAARAITPVRPITEADLERRN